MLALMPVFFYFIYIKTFKPKVLRPKANAGGAYGKLGNWGEEKEEEEREKKGIASKSSSLNRSKLPTC